jgi:hypothetical protein
MVPCVIPAAGVGWPNLLASAGVAPFAVIGVVVAIGVALAIFAHIRQKRRTAALRAAAESLGLTDFRETAAPPPGCERLPLFSRGHGRTVRNAMSGTVDDIEVDVFDYRFTVGSGKSRHTYSQTVCALRDPHLALPAFELRPESVWNKLGALLGFDDIDFPESPEFSRRFLLSGTNVAAVRALFRSEVRRALEVREGVSVQGARDRFVYFRAGRHTAPENVESHVREALQVLMLFAPGRGSNAPPAAV